MIRIINKKRYNTETAVKIATEDFSDGTNKYNCGRTSSLYRTRKGAYFGINLTCWQGERDTLEVLSEAEAMEQYEASYKQVQAFEDVFPGVEVKDA